MQEVIAYPVVSVVIKDPEAFGNEKLHQKADVKSVVSFEARDARFVLICLCFLKVFAQKLL